MFSCTLAPWLSKVATVLWLIYCSVSDILWYTETLYRKRGELIYTELCLNVLLFDACYFWMTPFLFCPVLITPEFICCFVEYPILIFSTSLVLCCFVECPILIYYYYVRYCPVRLVVIGHLYWSDFPCTVDKKPSHCLLDSFFSMRWDDLVSCFYAQHVLNYWWHFTAKM